MNENTGWNGTHLAAGKLAKVHGSGMGSFRGCVVKLLFIASRDLWECQIVRGNRTWNDGNRTTVNSWYLDASVL